MATSRGLQQEELSIQSSHDATPSFFLGLNLPRSDFSSKICQKGTISDSDNTADLTGSPYGSIRNSSEQRKGGFQKGFPSGLALPTRGLLPRKTITLKYFNKEITAETQARFNDLKELFEKPLYDYVLKSKPRFTAISMRLKVLGESEETAKPWIVIQCDRRISSRVKQFFKEPHIKELYQTQDTECSMPTLDIFVWDKPARLLGKTAVYSHRPYKVIWEGKHNRLLTWSGRTIRCGSPSSDLIGTMGGIIQVELPGNDIVLYGMTAGHIAKSAEEEERSLDTSVDDDGASTSGDDEDELVLQLESESQDENQTIGLNSQDDWVALGDLHYSTTENKKGPNLDWALIDFKDPMGPLPNKTILGEDVLKVWKPNDTSNNENNDGQMTKMVFIVGKRPGEPFVLSVTPSFLLLYPGTELTAVYTLTGRDVSVLERGICGSWVVNCLTLEVYGYIVAVDMFGEAFVVPFDSALDDIKKTLGATKVSLPTVRDYNRKMAHIRALRRSFDSRLSNSTPSSESRPRKKARLVNLSLPTIRDAGYYRDRQSFVDPYPSPSEKQEEQGDKDQLLTESNREDDIEAHKDPS